MEASMNTKIVVGISALISLVYVVVDEIAVNYMLAAANGAAMAAAHRGGEIDFVALRRQAQTAVKDLQELQQLPKKADTGARMQCREQAWPYYSGACLEIAEERQVRMVTRDMNSAVTAAAPKLMQAANF
jgi:hypothetical protein